MSVLVSKEKPAYEGRVSDWSSDVGASDPRPAPIQTAGSRGVWWFGQASDMVGFAPDWHATAILDVWAPYYIERVQAVLDGTWKTSDVWHGLKEGMVVMAPYNPKLPPEAVEAAETVQIGRAHV